MSALDRQEGGGHYKDMPIQPVEFITKNKIGFLEGCVIKRVCRWRAKNGIEDLRKAIHELELLIELEDGAKTDAARDTLVEQAMKEYWSTIERVPVAEAGLPRIYRVPEGGMWPKNAPDGSVIEAWRLGQWKRIGTMHDDRFVRDGELAPGGPAG